MGTGGQINPALSREIRNPKHEIRNVLSPVKIMALQWRRNPSPRGGMCGSGMRMMKRLRVFATRAGSSSPSNSILRQRQVRKMRDICLMNLYVAFLMQVFFRDPVLHEPLFHVLHHRGVAADVGIHG